MPISSAHAGTTAPPFSADIDARWTMAYAAALGDSGACYFDTTASEPVVAHPLFPVCVEWIGQTRRDGAGRAEGLTADEARRGVHYSMDLTLHRPVRAGDTATVTPTVIGVERHRAGVVMTTRFEAVDASGSPLWSNDNQGLLRDVELVGDAAIVAERAAPLPRFPGDDAIVRQVAVPISAVAAHIYTECARIWNPIHTDAAVAAAAGLPAIILHGTATLALAVSQVVAEECGGDPTRVARVAGRFGAMVLMPSELTVVVAAPVDDGAGNKVVCFEARTETGAAAVRHGAIALR